MATEDPRVLSALDAAVVEAVENLAFAVAEPLSEGPPEAGEPCPLWASLETCEPAPGTLGLQASRGLAVAMVSDLHCLPPEEVSDAATLEFLGELLNTVGGGFLRRLLPAGAGYGLGLPETGTGRPPPIASPPVAQAAYAIDGGLLSISWCPRA